MKNTLSDLDILSGSKIKVHARRCFSFTRCCMIQNEQCVQMCLAGKLSERSGGFS